ncbi:MAG: hypothetical protein JW870_00845 [Candidatus Delongbacteria bacterium]|nr:hypothetical protein [Candidatus Delongbacteria bacterium]MBN2821088.1 hypothetical protein [Bacteroidales bacterium]
MKIKMFLSNFLFKCLLIYAAIVILGLSLKINPIIADNFIEYNNQRFAKFDNYTDVNFQKNRKSAFDTKIYVKYKNSKQWTHVEYLLVSWYIAFLPKVIFISLILATSFQSIKNKVISIVAGFLLTNIMVHFILYIRIYILKIQAQQILGDYSNLLKDRIMLFLHNNVAVYGWICFVLPVFAWLLVAFRTKMIKELFVLPKLQIQKS